VALTAAQETGGVENGVEKTGGDLEFWDERKMIRGRLLFIGSKISAAVLKYNRY
jgi:hypothetical protein